MRFHFFLTCRRLIFQFFILLPSKQAQFAEVFRLHLFSAPGGGLFVSPDLASIAVTLSLSPDWHGTQILFPVCGDLELNPSLTSIRLAEMIAETRCILARYSSIHPTAISSRLSDSSIIFECIFRIFMHHILSILEHPTVVLVANELKY